MISPELQTAAAGAAWNQAHFSLASSMREQTLGATYTFEWKGTAAHERHENLRRGAFATHDSNQICGPHRQGRPQIIVNTEHPKAALGYLLYLLGSFAHSILAFYLDPKSGHELPASSRFHIESFEYLRDFSSNQDGSSRPYSDPLMFVPATRSLK